jgi:hypothetical protein
MTKDFCLFSQSVQTNASNGTSTTPLQLSRKLVPVDQSQDAPPVRYFFALLRRLLVAFLGAVDQVPG